MQFSQHQQQSQQQLMKQVMSPKLFQLFRTFQSSYHDLSQEAESFSQDNPVVDFTPPTFSGSTPPASHRLAPDFDSSIPDSSSSNLFDHLLTQLNSQHLPRTTHDVVLRLIESLDNHGYLQDYDCIKDSILSDFKISNRKLNECLSILQGMEPDGIGSRNLKESLLLQLDHYDLESDDLYQLIKQTIQSHLEALSNLDYSSISKHLAVPVEGVKHIHDFIKHNLTPHPASLYTASKSHELITPSFNVFLDNSNSNLLEITNLEETSGFQLSLSQSQLKLLSDPNLDNESKTFLKDKIEQAQLFIERIKLRQESMNKLIHHISYKQFNFFKYGKHYLEPLPQKDIAEFLDISRSTVSRILSSKYVRTPHGVFPLKVLCPRNYFGKSSERLKYLINDLLARYPKYSDQQITFKLHDIGISIARRTVSKYRSLLDIDSSYYR